MSSKPDLSGKHTRQVWRPSGREKEIACDLCGTAGARALSLENGYCVRRCACGLVYVSPQPDDEDLAQFYAQYFPEESGDLWAEIMRRNFDADAERLLSMAPAPGTALDIGCGHGSFLLRVKEKGWKVSGLDLSPEAVARATSYGIDARRAMFKPGLFEAESFDMVTAWYVLEHVREPMAFLKEIARILRPGGLLGLRVPNMDFARLFLGLKKVPALGTLLALAGIDTDGKSSHFNLLDPPAHLYGFSPGTLNAYLKKLRFEEIAIVPSMPVDVGSRGTRLVKDALFSSTALLHRASDGRVNWAPAINAYCRKHG